MTKEEYKDFYEKFIKKHQDCIAILKEGNHFCVYGEKSLYECERAKCAGHLINALSDFPHFMFYQCDLQPNLCALVRRGNKVCLCEEIVTNQQKQ